MTDTGSKAGPTRKQKPASNGCFYSICLLGILFILFGVLIPPAPGGIKCVPANASMQTAHMIGLAMFAYANDNNGNYPDGKSSTEAFQKLIDGNYITDPTIFYIPFAGKVEASPGQK